MDPSKVKIIKLHDNVKEVEQLFEHLKLEAVKDDTSQERENLPKEPLQIGEDLQLTVSEKMTCSYCCFDFADREEQKSHYKSDWHRFNLKQRLKGIPAVDEQQFEEMTGDISSISGSDSEDSSSDSEKESASPKKGNKPVQSVLSDSEDESTSYHIEGIGRRHPRVFVRNGGGQLMSVYRCILYTKKTQPETVDELLTKVTDLPKQTHWAVFMLAGGHFAAAIFNGNEIIAHKTFHRYVVRAKRGTAQSAFDNQGHFAKSGGAFMRRHHEQALIEDIKELVSSWAADLGKCSQIFMRATGAAKNTFFNGKNPPLSRSDPRIRMIPFVTRRPTFKELQRVYDLLTSIEIYGSEATLDDHIRVSPKRPKAPMKVRPVAEIPTPVSQDKNAESSSGSDIELYLGEETIDTQSQLQEFECTAKPKGKQRKKKKKKPGQERHQQAPEDDIRDEQTYHLRNELYTACKTGNIESLQSMLAVFSSIRNSQQTSPSDTNITTGVAVGGDPSTAPDTDKQTLSPEEAAGSTENRPVSPLVGSSDKTKSSTDSIVTIDMLNEPFGENSVTLLHVAAREGNKDCLRLLLEAGADPAIKDKKGQVPYSCSCTKDTRNEFRRFMAAFPDKFDYTKAQVPGPLTEDMDQDRKAKDAERKKAKRQERKERLKDRKAEEMKQKEEDRERQRYLALSDREKRALAAEKRLTAQLSHQGTDVPVLKRCFQCAADMTDKVPFEYSGNIFCTSKCLQTHRKTTTSKS